LSPYNFVSLRNIADAILNRTILSPVLIFGLIALYFGCLIVISFYTGRDDSNESFFKGNRNSPWYVVAFGMIGASLSGVTFISVPGWVDGSQFSYLQTVFGYLVGYGIIALVLLPLYYKLNLTSIYTYLGQRFGSNTYYTGAWFFLVSRLLGSAFRLYVVADVLHFLVLQPFGVPFWATVAGALLLIMVYTNKGGIKTIVYTDTLQTLFMLLAVGFTIFILKDKLLQPEQSFVSYIVDSSQSQVFFWDNFGSDKRHFAKQFISGIFLAIAMTGLDQDMMQKNLTCKSLRDAQKNMFWFSTSLIVVNLMFLSLGVLLYDYAASIGLAETGDRLYAAIAMGSTLSPWVGFLFIFGVTAAAYSSADSTLTSLTTSFCIDILRFENQPKAVQYRIRKRVHWGVAVVMFLVIVGSRPFVSKTIIETIFEIAGYTYGPLLGFFAFGLLTKKQVRDKWVPYIAVLSPLLCFLLKSFSTQWLGYTFSFELLPLNGFFTFIGMWVLSKSENTSATHPSKTTETP